MMRLCTKIGVPQMGPGCGLSLYLFKPDLFQIPTFSNSPILVDDARALRRGILFGGYCMRCGHCVRVRGFWDVICRCPPSSLTLSRGIDIDLSPIFTAGASDSESPGAGWRRK